MEQGREKRKESRKEGRKECRKEVFKGSWGKCEGRMERWREVKREERMKGTSGTRVAEETTGVEISAEEEGGGKVTEGIEMVGWLY